jgi:putative transposase
MPEKGLAMPHTKRPRFIHEFELAPTPAQARILRIRLDLGRQMYNAMLGKARARLNRCKSIYAWKQAMALFKEARKCAKRKDEAGAKALRAEAKRLQDTVVHRVLREERSRYAPETLFRVNKDRHPALAKDNNLKAPAPTIMTRFRQEHFHQQLDYKSVQAMADRAYKTVNQIRFRRPTRRKDGSLKFPRVHFVPRGEARAIESTSIYWRGDRIEWNTPMHKLRIPALFDARDPKGIQAHALAQLADAVKTCESIRVLSRIIRGKERWFAQLTIKGHPAWKEAQYPPGHGKRVGIDFGPTNIGICYQEPDGTLRGAKLELAEGLRHDYARLRRIERYMDRSRRENNPQNYHPDGTIRRTPGQKLTWYESKRYQRAKAQRAELWRRYAARRKNLLGRLANEIITKGTIIQIEALSYKAWQKQWGKSIGRGAPGMLVRMLKHKAALVGGELIEFPTRTTKFSQLCHGRHGADGGVVFKKKPWNQKPRIHQCECGIGPLDRDIYSAFLAYHFDFASEALDIGAARAAFATLQCGAGGIQGMYLAASATPVMGSTAPRAKGDYCGSSAGSAQGEECGRSVCCTGSIGKPIGHPTFQELSLSAHPASTEPGMHFPGDARADPDQENGRADEKEGNKFTRRPPRKRRSSQEGGQLSLFPGLGGPAG